MMPDKLSDAVYPKPNDPRFQVIELRREHTRAKQDRIERLIQAGSIRQQKTRRVIRGWVWVVVAIIVIVGIGLAGSADMTLFKLSHP